MGWTTKARAGLFGACVAAALAFGAASALEAAPAGAVACRDPLADGTCTSDAQCASFCPFLNPGSTTGTCRESIYCCYCR